jgi:hypothetical protein
MGCVDRTYLVGDLVDLGILYLRKEAAEIEKGRSGWPFHEREFSCSSEG